MATFLYKLGRLAFRRRRIVALLWVVLLVGAGAGASSINTTVEDDFSLPSSEAQTAFELIEERSAEGGEDVIANAARANIVFQAPDGEKVTASEHRETIAKIVEEVQGLQQTDGVVDPFAGPGTVTEDQSIGFAAATFLDDQAGITDDTKDALADAAEIGRDAGLTVEMGGNALDADLTGEGGHTGEMIGIMVAALVLILTFGSLVAAGLPLVTALIGVGVSVLAITALGPTFGLSATSSTLAMMIGLAVGIDYALFIASRYRAELIEGREQEEAAGRAVGTAGSAVVFAGLTVVIALAGLAVINVPILTKMGMAAAGAVVVAVFLAITLVPAALGMVGKRIFGRKVRKASPETGVPVRDLEAEKRGLGSRWAHFILRRPMTVLITSVLALGVVAIPVAGMSLGLPDEGSKPESSTQRKAYDLMADGFGPGTNAPLMIAIDTKDSDNPKAAAEEVAKQVEGMDQVVAVLPPEFNESGSLAVVTAIPENRPGATETEDLVKKIRAERGDVEEATGAKVMVTGSTAANVDFSTVMNDALVPYLALVVGLAFLLLIMVFRSILVPLKAALGFLLSVLAALGAVVAVFQWGWLSDLFGVAETGPIMSMIPIIMIGVIFGLAMDYEVFLVTRMREAYVHGESSRDAITSGFKLGGRVVAAAAAIMISVFAGFIGDSDTMIKMMGLGLSIAILLDAFVVRMAITPAVLALVGDKAWWLPAWLDRIVPNVDVEGERLQQYLAAEQSGPGHGGESGGSGGGESGGPGGDGGPSGPVGPGGSHAAAAQPSNV